MHLFLLIVVGALVGVQVVRAQPAAPPAATRVEQDGEFTEEDLARRARPPQRKNDIPFADPRGKTVAYGREQVRVPTGVELVELDFAEAREWMSHLLVCSWVGSMILDEARPSEQFTCVPKSDTLRLRGWASMTPAQDDIVEITWTYQDIPLRVLMTRNAVQFDFRVRTAEPQAAAHSATDLAAELRRQVEAVFRLSREEDRTRAGYEIDIPWESAVADGFEFSTNPDLDIRRMAYRLQRIDAFCEGGVFSILVYRKIPQYPVFTDGTIWFPEAMRKALHEKQRPVEGEKPPANP